MVSGQCQYKICCLWQVYGYAYIEADSLEEAIEKARGSDTSLPDGDYVEGSFEVDEEATREMDRQD